MKTNDLAARQLAVNPDYSVLVQAPAGSGKTTLLVERFLTLLARVEAPEEILAITFTRKAASVMRDRVLHYLRMESAPEERHEIAAYKKAQAVRAKAEEWSLLQNPSRLRIMTIDSFCASLVRQMPLLSGLGQMPRLADHPEPFYREAARRTLAALDEDALAPALTTLFGWRDNDTQLLETLISDLLPQREKWLRILGTENDVAREDLQGCLASIVAEFLQSAGYVLAEALMAAGSSPKELVELARFGARNLRPQDQDAPIAACRDLRDFPECSSDALAGWRGLIDLVLTRDGKQVRKSVTIALGFPAKTPEKARMVEILAELSSLAPESIRALDLGRQLPPAAYQEGEWEVLSALIDILRRAAAELELVFAESGQMDFSGVSAAALRALGPEDDPTDLALYLDHAIQHLLMDEFQDSDWNQMLLVERLTAGWQNEDGRTLFMVGDPMQSIYRFREADVSLFVRCRDQGVGDIQLEYAQLTANFRSSAELVTWVNDHVGPAFPADDDLSVGAVKFAPSQPACPTGGEVILESGVGVSRSQAANTLADHIEKALGETNEDYDIAVLVRSRTHLAEILPALNERGIPFSALQLNKLLEQPAIRDLHALAKLLWHPADRTAGFAVMRAPWCGLLLADLVQLANGHKGTIERLLADSTRTTQLSAGAQNRLCRLTGVLEAARERMSRWPLREVVQAAWRALGGPEIYATSSDRKDVARYLAMVDAFSTAGRIADWSDFEAAVERKRAEGAVEGARVQVMTIHESKGLEFDMVVLPALERGARREDESLLEWLPLGGSQESLLLSPLRAADADRSSSLVRLIRHFQGHMAAAERKRLLYVAATRARHRLVLSATASSSISGDITARQQDSMLADLWPSLSAHFSLTNDVGDIPQPEILEPSQAVRRVPEDWRPPCPAPTAWTPAFMPAEDDVCIEYDWAGQTARQMGRVLHRLLEHIGHQGADAMDKAQLEALKVRIPLLLQREGMGDPETLAMACKRIATGLDNTLSDPMGCWLLQQHTQSTSELPVMGVVKGRICSIRLDRTFVVDGQRWIVDWKGAYHDGADLDGFLASETQRHKRQMEDYRELVTALDGKAPTVGLYLPMHAAWIEVPG